MDSAGPVAARQRKACIHCYQKKVRCDFSAELLSCSRCKQYDLDCILPGETQRTSRSSIRSGFEDLSSRVQHLEDVLFLNAQSGATSLERQPTPLNRQSSSFVSKETSTPVPIREPITVRTYRGPNSPWTSLVSHLDSQTGSETLESLQKNAARLANEERSHSLSQTSVFYDLLDEFPQIGQDDVFRFVRLYAIEAPYPIMHYHSLLQVTTKVLHTQRAECWGQVSCVLMYMAFGSARVSNVESSTLSQEQSGIYMRRAWEMLPQLFLDHDLWALKAVSLMVHYLQASSKPEPCWALLGAASRMAICLGFHQKSHKAGTYSAIEMEEGKRAWWLCYVMEKTFCTTFGYPKLTSGSREQFDIEYPVVFETSADVSRIEDDDMIFGQNEIDAVSFFRDMIELTYLRDQAMESRPKSQLDAQSLNSILQTILKDDQQGQFTLSTYKLLRKSIRDLARFNTIQVIAMSISPRSYLPPTSVLSARSSIQIILNTKTTGTTMCLWMWLYYAFTAAVVLFLQCVTTPLAEETVFDLTLLSDIQALCMPVAASSEGAKRVMEIAGQMERVAFEVVKMAVKAKAGKRAAVDEVEKEQVKIRKKINNLAGSQAELGGAGRASAATEGIESAARTELESGIDREMLESMPQTFQWDQWDQWLEDIPFELE